MSSQPLRSVSISPTVQQPPLSPSIISTGGGVSLESWLQVPWFYPPYFELDGVFRTNDRLIARGATEEYQFLSRADDSSANQRGILPERWRNAVFEIRDHDHLAPGVYVGLSPFRIREVEPEWIWAEPRRVSGLRDVPSGADDFAIVTRRLDQFQRLDQVLARTEASSEHVALLLCRRLRSFHRYEQSRARRTYKLRARAHRASLRRRWVTDLRADIDRIVPRMAVPASVSLLESGRFLSWFADRHIESFVDRGHRRMVIDCHGDLRSNDVFFQSFGERERCLIVNRAERTLERLSEDLLWDIASLAVDLEIRGYITAGRTVETIYFSLSPEVYDSTLWGFYKCAVALNRFLRGAEENPGSTPLSIALRYALALPATFVIGLSPSAPFARELATTLAQLTDGKVVYWPDDLYKRDKITGSELFLNRIMQQAANGKPIVLVESFEEHRSKGARELPLGTMEGLAESVATRFGVSYHRSFTTENDRTPQPIDNSELSIAERALSILRELRSK